MEMATRAIITREAFVVRAVEHDDVQIAQQYFAQEEVIAEVERVNAFFLAREAPIFSLDGPEDAWYFTQPPGHYFSTVGPRSLIFCTAMEEGSIAFMQWLFAPSQAASMGVTLAAMVPFVGELAADMNQVEVLELLVASEVFTTMFNEDQQQDLLNGMLRTAVERNYEEAMMHLVAHGAQVNPPATQSRPIQEDMLALCACFGTAHYVDVLVANGAFVVGANVLYYASTMQNVSSARQLLKRGVDWGNVAGTTTPLHGAANVGSTELVLLLLHQGFADVDAPDSDGATAIVLAAKYIGYYGDAYYAHQTQIDAVSVLRQYGAKLP